MSVGVLRGIWFAIGIGLCLVFLYGCLMPNPPSEPGIPHFDKIEHGGAFLVMGAWFAMLFPRRPSVLLLTLSLYAAFTEVLQWAIGYRDGDPLDWVADTAGLTLGLVLVHLVALDWLSKLESRVATARN